MSGVAVVVTGIGSRLGHALCVEFCAQGRPVVGLGQSPEDLEAVAARAGPLFTGVLCDVTDPAAVTEAFGEVRSRVGPADILVNNAGHYPRRDILHETAESFMATVAVNLGGVVACTRAALADMVERGEGRLLNVTRAADLPVPPATAAAAASGAAARVFTQALVADLADRFPRIVASDWWPWASSLPLDGPDGFDLDPAQAARWGVALALMREPWLNGTTWEGGRELPPPRPLRRRIADRLLGRSDAARRLS